MRLIGQRCKCGDALSWLILIGRRFIHTRTERSHNFSRKTNQVNLKLLFSFQGAISLKDLVTIPEWSHLFPSRTQKLSTPGPKIAMLAIVNRGRCRFARVLARVFFIVWYLLQQVQASVRDRSLAALKPFRFFGVSGAGILWMSFSFFVFFSVLLFSSCWLLKCIDQNDQVFFKLCRWVMTPAEPCYVRYLWMQLWFHETKHYIEIY